MSFLAKLAKKIDEDARLAILQALSVSPANEMNESVLDSVLNECGHKRSREWVRQQMRYLADIGGIVIDDDGPLLVATITRAGLDHVERKAFLEGVQKTKPEF